MKKILFLLTILMFIPILGNSQTIRKKIAKKGNIFINKTIVDGGGTYIFPHGAKFGI